MPRATAALVQQLVGKRGCALRCHGHRGLLSSGAHPETAYTNFLTPPDPRGPSDEPHDHRGRDPRSNNPRRSTAVSHRSSCRPSVTLLRGLVPVDPAGVWAFEGDCTATDLSR